MERNFRYIDVCRKPDGSLRDWYEYDILSKSENILDKHVPWTKYWKDKYLCLIDYIKDKDNEK